MENKGYSKRRNYFIDKSFQANFIVKFCLLVMLGGALTIGALYYLGMRSTTVSIVNSRVIVKSTSDFLLPVLIQTVAVVVVIVGAATVFLTLFVSHKIAGPLYRLKKSMQELAEGNLTSDIKLRKNDQLRDIADTFNQMVDKLKERFSR